MKRTALKPWKSLPELAFAGCRMKAFLSVEETEGLSCYHIRVPPGASVAPAYHKKAVELIWVLEGGGSAEIGGERLRLRRGDSIFIPPPTPHGFRAGRAGLVLLAVLAPRVDSATDFYSVEPEGHGRAVAVSGRWSEGGRSARRHGK